MIVIIKDIKYLECEIKKNFQKTIFLNDEFNFNKIMQEI